MIQVNLSEDVKIKEVLDNNRDLFTRNLFDLKRKLYIFITMTGSTHLYSVYYRFRSTQHKTIC